MEERNVFERPKRYFKAGGKEFSMEFIPAEHFQAVITELLTLAVGMQANGQIQVDKEGAKVNLDALMKGAKGALDSVLKNQIYELMADIIQYQNDEKVSALALKKRVSLKEMAAFIALVATDDEVMDAAEEFIAGVGKFMDKIPGVTERMSKALGEKGSDLTMLKSELSSRITSESTTEQPSTSE